MRQGLKLLVLAGSAEARQIAAACQAGGADVRALISEPPKGPNPMPVPSNLVDFSKADAVVDAMRGVDAMVDASHGFDASMSDLGAAAARQLGLPFLIYRRPVWEDAVLSAPDVAAAMPLIERGARVFCATGWASLPEMTGFGGAVLFLRQTSPHDRAAPYGFVRLCFGEAPFSVASETALFRKLHIDTLMCRNLGGAASRPKVDAALVLGLKVILIDRPPLPQGVQKVENTQAAIAWVQDL